MRAPMAAEKVCRVFSLKGTPGAKGHGRESLSRLLLDYSEDIIGIEDHIVLAVERDLGSRVLGKDDNIAFADLDFVGVSHRDDLCRLRLFLSRVREHYACGRRLLTLHYL